MSNKLLLALLILSTLSFCSCGGSGGGDSAPTVKNSLNFTGDWDVLYDVLLDECGLVEEGTSAFEDMHQVTESGESVVLASSALPGGVFEGMRRADDSFEVSVFFDGDLFGDGIYCSLSEELAYNDVSSDTAKSLYRIRLACDDGFVCDSALTGMVTRQ